MTLAVVLAAAACGGGEGPPTVLADGSPVRRAPIELDGVDGPTVLTTVRRVDASHVASGSPLAICLDEAMRGVPVTGAAVLRVGIDGESVTLHEPGRHGVYACDAGTGTHDEDLPWCGRAFGRLRSGRLRDPRLDLGCTTGDGLTVGFVWVEPSPEAAYVAVRRPGYTEVYETVPGVPVRIASTTGVDPERSSVVLELSEHTSPGRLLRRYRVEARAAG